MNTKKRVFRDRKSFSFIDLFSGIGGFHYALKSLGGECVMACEIDKDCRRIYTENFGIQPEEDITKLEIDKIPNFSLLTGGFPCFVAGTIVLTNNGYKAIENVSLEDKLLTHKNKFQNILNLQTKNYTGELYEIRAKYHPDALICTPEHPFYVREKKRVWNREEKKPNFYFENPIWKKASELTENDLLGMPINQNEIIPKFTFKKKINNLKTVDVNITLDQKEQWFMMGYFVGDGWIEDGKKSDGRLKYLIRFSVANKDIDIIVEKIRKVLPITDKKADSGACKKYGCQNFLWWNILNEFGRYAHGKKLPQWIHDAPKDLIQEFINGYICADGNVNKDKNIFSLTSVSKDLILGVQRLYLKLGSLFSINKCNRPKTCVIEGRVCNQRDTYTIKGSLKYKKRYTSFIEGDYAWFTISKMGKKIVKDEPVYNFEVEKDNSYIVENIVAHNCQAFSHSGKQKGFLDKVRGTLFFNVLEILTKRQPDYFILENVKNLKGHDKGKTWKTIYDSLIDAGYNTYSEPIIASPTHFGIPQNRERVFIIGKRRDLGELPEFPVYKKKKTDLYDILEDDEEIEEKELEKIQIDEDLEKVLDHWEEFLQHFKEKKIKLPTFPIWTTYFVEEYDTDDLPAWKAKFIEQNIAFYLEHQEFLDEWLERSKHIEGFKGSLAKFEWQCGKFQDDDSVYNLLFQLRPSGIRVKRRDYSPALVAMNQVVYIGKRKRKLSRREVARLQSFPEDCELEKNQNKCYKQFGNAVNVKVVEEIAKFLLGKK